MDVCFIIPDKSYTFYIYSLVCAKYFIIKTNFLKILCLISL